MTMAVAPPSDMPSSPGAPSPHGRFLPGAMVAKRFRIIGLLGRGGMGEVYRADDLKLGHAVALKFLPEGLERDAHQLDRFLDEVRTALRVTHPNVCRIHDISDADGQHFLTMEYVDGEDLASLLRRIGRLPHDKALQLARQLCAGLGAAHEQGILHRDLKPANIMIDGRGQVKITDFGLAGLEASIRPDHVAGTPAYMAPEQLAGTDVSVRSDIYALGLVLYELFTGKAAVQGSTMAEIQQSHQDSTHSTPSTLVPNIDPAVERVIQHCLEKNPADRPMSALSVAAALPGGDPIAAALAAGETPSPELVAQLRSKSEEALKPWLVVVCLVVILAGLITVSLLAPKSQVVQRTPLLKPPVVLAEKAREIAETLGLPIDPRNDASGFLYNHGYLNHIQYGKPTTAANLEDSTDSSGGPDWNELERGCPSGLHYYYRHSPRRFLPEGVWKRVTPNRPAANVPGMWTLWLEPSGRLLRFEAVPLPKPTASVSNEASSEQADEDNPNTDDVTAQNVDWENFWQAAQIDPQTLTDAEPEWLPTSFADQRHAWTAPLPQAADETVRFEAASWAGEPVFFRTVFPWEQPPRATTLEQQKQTKTQQKINEVITATVGFGILLGGVLLAWRNLRAGRGHRQGAFRLGIAALLSLVPAMFVAPAAYFIVPHLFVAGFMAFLCWLLYLGVEPYFRRIWPRVLVSWIRLLDGRWRDPLVGRHVLIGIVYGVVTATISHLGKVVPEWMDVPGGGLEQTDYQIVPLLGSGFIIEKICSFFTASLQTILIVGVQLLLMRLALRKQWLVVIAAILLSVGVSTGFQNDQWKLMVYTPQIVLFIWMFFRGGLLPLMVGTYVGTLLQSMPVTLDFSVWYAGVSYVVFAVIGLLATYGAYVSMSGRAMFQSLVPADSLES